MIVLRTMLFIPGHVMKMLQKANSLPADAIIIDLEDAVPLTDKITARDMVKNSIDMISSGSAEIFVRVNSLVTDLTYDDLKKIVCDKIYGIMLPKSESKEDIQKVDKMLEEIEKEKGLKIGRIHIVPLLETAKGVLNAFEIGTSSNRILALSFGAVDFTRDMGTNLSKEGTELFYARSRIVLAAKAAGIQAIDTPFINVADDEGLLNDSRLAKQLGFQGKMVIHPKQIDPVNANFTPTENSVQFARKIVEAFKEAESKGLGAISLEGKMIDTANYQQAKDLLSLTEIIREKEERRKTP